jgi:hypothetical protein
MTTTLQGPGDRPFGFWGRRYAAAEWRNAKRLDETGASGCGRWKILSHAGSAWEPIHTPDIALVESSPQD